MCGIAGIWNLNGSQLPLETLVEFTDSIQSRGPDGAGHVLFNDNTLGLGHRRLSILDLSDLGHQPMYSADGRYAITYNGEIFNFQEIRDELQAKGYEFKSDTDTEVILSAWSEWGIAALNRFNGMWAFAVWDHQERKLTICRDRFGIKPLYYLWIPNKIFAFASETFAFKHLRGFERSLNMHNLNLQLSGFPIAGSGHSIFNGIHQLLPGHYAEIMVDEPFKQKRWWHILDHVSEKNNQSLDDQKQAFYELFRDACKLRLISDVPIATALSGGLDSTAVYSTVFDIIKNEQLGRTHSNAQTAFVATFPGLAMDERKYAEEAVKYTGGSVEYLVDDEKDLVQRIISDTIRFDTVSYTPITSVSGIYRGMKKAGITVSMDGHGVDEMLYGYRDMLYKLFYHHYKKGNVKEYSNLKNIIIPTYDDISRPNAIQNIDNLMRLGNSKWRQIKHKIGNYVRHQKDEFDFTLPKELLGLGDNYDFSHLPFEDQLVLNETFVYTLPSILRDFDRAGMMNGVEIRMPFMDWRIVTFLFSLPVTSKIGNGFNKLLVREAMKGKMSEAIRTRTHKIGIGSPVEKWVKTDMKEWILDHFHSKAFQENPLTLDKKFGESLFKEYNDNSLDLRKCQKIWVEINAQLLR